MLNTVDCLFNAHISKLKPSQINYEELTPIYLIYPN